MKKTRSKFYTAIFAALLLWAAPGHAEEEVEIERIVVTSSRTREAVRNSTKSVTILDSQDIKESNAQTIPDILRSEAGIHIRDLNGTGKQVNVDMRGFGETGPSNMLVLIDGRRVNAIDLSNTDWSQISLSQVERIEILRGASSVLYGDNASSGVVNIITKKGSGKPSVKIESRGGSFKTAATGIESSGGNEKNSYRISAEYFDTDGYRKNSSLFRKDFNLRAGKKFNHLLETDLNFGYHTDRHGLPGALKTNELSNLGRRATTKPDDKAYSHDWFSSLEITNDLLNHGKLSMGMSVRTREVDALYASSSWRNQNHIVTWGLTPKYSLENMFGSMPNKFILGIDFYHDEDDIRDGSTAGGNDKIEIKKTSLGLYFQDQLHLNNHLLIKGGARQEIARYNFEQLQQVQLKEKSKLSDTVCNIGVAVPYSQDSSIFLDYSSSFRYPLVDEFFSSNTFGFGGLNSSLKAQTGENIDTGIRHFFTKDIETNLTLFAHFIKNEIFYNPGTFANTNYDRTVHKGIEFTSNIKLNDHLRLFSNYTFTSAKFGKGAFKGNHIPGVPEHKFSAGMRITPYDNIKINLTGNYVGDMYLISDQNNSQTKLKDWLTIDLNINYAISDFEVFLGLNNIFNTYYSEYGVLSSNGITRSFYPAPGRNVIAGCRYKF